MNKQALYKDIEANAEIRVDEITKKTQKLTGHALELAYLLSNMDEVHFAYTLPEELARDYLITHVKPVLAKMARYTELNQLRVHFHLPPAKSLVRLWNDKGGDDLQSFRETIIHVYETQKPLQAIELGKGGFALRGIVPIINEDTKTYLGSVEVFYEIFDLLSFFPENEKLGFVSLIDKKKWKHYSSKRKLTATF